MSRKGIGIASFDRSRLTTAHFALHGSSLRATNAQALEAQLAVFRSLLTQFAHTHARDIRSDPAFRAQFARMCSAIGVDPLAGNSAGGGSSAWAQLLGRTVNDFYFGVAVRIVDMCGGARGENGGLMALGEVRERLAAAGGAAGADVASVSEDDVRRAVETLAPLGAGYGIVRVGRGEYVRSVPRELSGDEAAAVEAAQVLGFVSMGLLCDNLGWERARCRTVIDDLVAGGMLWVDAQTGGEHQYWSPTFMTGDDEAHVDVALDS